MPKPQTQPSSYQFNPYELGLPQPKAKPTTQDGQPRGNGQFPLAHPATFAGLFSAGNRSYYQWFDEALRYGWQNKERILFDPVVNSSMRLRVTPTALLTTNADPEDDTDPDQVEAAKNYDRFKRRFKGYIQFRRWLLYNGTFKGRAGAFTRWEKVWDRKENRTFENPVEMRPIDGDKLAFHWDGRVGVTVGAGFQGDTDYIAGYGRVYFFTPEERDQTVVFEFEPEDSDFFDPFQAGLIHGAGLRHRLYWLWALKSRLWAASIDFLEWWARGILIFYFQHGNSAHLTEVTKWVQQFDGQWQRIMPYPVDGPPGFKPVERIEPNATTNNFLQTLITSYLDDLIRQIIIGQTLTTKAGATGLGSGVAEAHVGTFEQIIKYDATILDECETYQVCRQWYEANYPGMPHARVRSEVDSPNVQQLMDAAESIYQMGGNVPEEPLMQAAGLPETKEGDTILTQVQPMQPAAVDGLPQGVPETDAQPVGQQPQRMARDTFARLLDRAHRDSRAARIVRLARQRWLEGTLKIV